MLSPKLRITSLSIAQLLPKPLFGIRGQLTQVSGEVFHFI